MYIVALFDAGAFLDYSQKFAGWWHLLPFRKNDATYPVHLVSRGILKRKYSDEKIYFFNRNGDTHSTRLIGINSNGEFKTCL